MIIYVYTYTELCRWEKKVVATLVDLRAAFDSVDRKILRRRLEEVGVGEKLRERIVEIYRETRNVVKVEGKYGKRCWTSKGMRQGCPLNPMLFNIVIADIEWYLAKGGRGDGGEREVESAGICRRYSDFGEGGRGNEMVD